MKWSLAVLVLAGTVAGGSARAQTIGIKAGPTWSRISASGNPDGPVRLGSVGGGAFLSVPLGALRVQAEMLAVRKGYRMQSGNSELDFRHDYLETSLLLGAAHDISDRLKPYFLAGPSLGRLLACDARGYTNVFARQDASPAEAPNDYCNISGPGTRRWDASLNGIAGVEARVGRGSALIEARYIHGLTSVADAQSTETIRNRTLQLLMGYSIALRR